MRWGDNQRAWLRSGGLAGLLLAGLLAVAGPGTPAAAQPAPAQAPAAQMPPRELELTQQADALQRQGRYDEAIVVATELLKLREQRLGPDHPAVAWSVARLGDLERYRGHYPEAYKLLKRSLAIREAKLGPDHPDVAHSLVLLALIEAYLGHYNAALPLAQRCLKIREAKLKPDAPEVASAANVLGIILRGLGRLAESEQLFRRAITIYEGRPGPTDVDLGHVLNNLGLTYAAAGRSADAEVYFKRAISIHERVLGPDHSELANTLSNYARMETQRYRYKTAEPIAQRALAIREKALGPEHPLVALSLADLSEIYRAQRRYDDAEPLARRALAIREKALGPDHPALIDSYNTLALIERERGHEAEAETGYKRAIAVGEKAFGPDSYGVINSRNNLSYLYGGQKKWEAALEQSRLATDSVVRYRAAEAEQRGAGMESERTHVRAFFFQRVWVAYHLAEDKPDQRAALTAEAFEAGQLVHGSKAGQAIATMAARFAVGDDPLAGVVRERQDLAERWQRLDASMVAAASKPPAERDNAAVAAARSELATIGQRLGALDAKIAQDYPGYAELATPRPVKLAELQQMLGPQEALLAFLSSSNQTWLWAVRRDRAMLYNYKISDKEVAKEVNVLRGRLDPLRNPDLKAFDVKRAYALHQSLLAPAAPLLEGVRHVFMVPDGALGSLPIGVLVTDPPAEKADYRTVPWLARKYAVTVLPAVSSLRALRQLARGAPAPAPFLGIGDPALGGAAGRTRGVDVGGLMRGSLADVAVLRTLPPLPDTADELRALAQAQGAGSDSVLLRDKASEATLKHLKLDQYRILAFATHGLVADELQDLAEPALVLTPPQEASRDDDGLLTASEIARLKLNADWVILSACNTASGDGTPGADRLSGLAKAFFYAGSRALLVSHWPVASQAAVRLTTGALDALKREPGIGRAEALRRAQMALLEDRGIARASHPMMWAPFVVVGEGAPGR
jgi:CHAT domain-containing protein/tetratricopeptide (TPR) repeat protein